MKPEDFKRGLRFLYGQEGWRRAAAEAFAVVPTTIDRWANGHSDIPGPAIMLLKQLITEKNRLKRQSRDVRAYQRRKQKEAGRADQS